MLGIEKYTKKKSNHGRVRSRMKPKWEAGEQSSEQEFALCSDRGCGGSGVVRRMSIVGYGGGKFRDGMLLVEGGIVNLGESFSGRGCRIGSGGLLIGSEACLHLV